MKNDIMNVIMTAQKAPTAGSKRRIRGEMIPTATPPSQKLSRCMSICRRSCSMGDAKRPTKTAGATNNAMASSIAVKMRRLHTVHDHENGWCRSSFMTTP
jgi:hypothetical protein